MSEIWKPIKGYEGIYEVSSYGRVRSLERIDTRPNPRTGKAMNFIKKQRIVTNKNHPQGYKTVLLYKGGSSEQFLLHRLVAQAFIPNPQNLPCVNHKDEDKTNNRADNLEWCSQQYNVNYGTGVSRMKSKIKARCKRICQYDNEGRLIATFATSIEAAEKTGICRSGIANALTGRHETSGGYRWKYADPIPQPSAIAE